MSTDEAKEKQARTLAREEFDRSDKSLQTISEIKKAISDSGISTAGIVGGIGAAAKEIRKALPSKEINIDDIKRIFNQMREEITDKRDKKILERAKAKVGDKGMKAGGLVKGKKKSVKPKKPSKAGRLAKRGYGAARK